jgi:hypothetical protein
MSHESDLIIPRPALNDKAVIIPSFAGMPRPPLDHSPTEQDARAAEALFAAKQKENSNVAGLLGLWTGTMLLNDLAMDMFNEPAEEEEPEKKNSDDDEKDGSP